MNRILFSTCLLLIAVTQFTQAQTLTPQDIILTKDTSFCPPATFQLESNVQGCSYVVESIPYNPGTVGGTSLNFFDDQVQGPFNIGFSFDYFCNTYTQFYICSNGWMGFSGGQTGTWVVNSIPNAGFGVPKNCVMAPWRDWNPGVSGGPYISYQTVGTAPNRQLIVSWTNIPMFLCSTTLGSFQVVLNETSNIIENHLTNVPVCLGWGGGDGTQGLHNLSGTVGVVVNGRNDNQFTAVNESWQYLPPTVQWIYQNDTVGNASTLDIAPGGVYPEGCEYVYAILDSGNGGIAIDSVLISRTCAVPLMSSVDVLCAGDSTGVAVFTDTSQAGQSQFLWNVVWMDQNGDTVRLVQSYNNVDSLVNVPIGVYLVEYFDQDGCNRQMGQIAVTEPPVLGASITNESMVSCPGSTTCDASADGNGAGGVPPYTYQWTSGELTQTATMLCAGWNYLTVTDANGCTSIDSVNILVPASIVTTTNPDTTICISNAASIVAASSGGTPPFTYVWTIDSLGGNIVSLNANDLVYPVTTKHYFVSSTDANNCPGDTSTITIRVRPKLFDTVSQVDTICPYDTIQLSVQGFGGDSNYTYSWSSGSFGSTISVSPDTSTTYYVTVADQCGTPPVVDSIYVQVGGYSPLRASIRSEDDSICAGENIYLIATGSGGFRGPVEYRYEWSKNNWDGNPYQFASPKKTSTYSVKITDLCLSPAGYDTITISVGEPVNPKFSANPSVSCTNADVVIKLENFNRNYDYDWRLGDGTYANNVQTDSLIHSYGATGCYDVFLRTVTDYGCLSEKTVPCLVNILSSPTANFTNTPSQPSSMDPLVEFFDKSVDAETIEWSIGGVSKGSEDYITQEFVDSGLYEVRLIATSADGCKDTITKSLRNSILQTIYIPTSFSPNGDGLNDVFGVFGEVIGQEGFELVIYDRWGTKVFWSTNPYHGWDGSIEGQGIAPIGTYAYTLRYIDRSKEKRVINGQIVISKSSTSNSSNN